MAHLKVPTGASLHAVHSFLKQEKMFEIDGTRAILEFHPKWFHMEPVALSTIAAWGGWARRQGLQIVVQNLSEKLKKYPARMRLFEQLGLEIQVDQVEHEEAGRFMPLVNIVDGKNISPVIGDVSALLHLDDDPESLAAVQYCVSELLRNVLEHSNSPDGAYVCAHRYSKGNTPRVSVAVADCGQGIASHLKHTYPEVQNDSKIALGLAMRPGVTGAQAGLYGTPDNAGAGLFITRCISKGTSGYFALCSGDGLFRYFREKNHDFGLYFDAFDDPRHKFWKLPAEWPGTIVALEIRTEKIADYQGFFQWIFEKVPSRASPDTRINFT